MRSIVVTNYSLNIAGKKRTFEYVEMYESNVPSMIITPMEFDRLYRVVAREIIKQQYIPAIEAVFLVTLISQSKEELILETVSKLNVSEDVFFYWKRSPAYIIKKQETENLKTMVLEFLKKTSK